MTASPSSASPRLILLIGLPAAGKTTFRRRALADWPALGTGDYPPSCRRAERLARDLDEILAQGGGAVVDDRLLTRAERAPLLALAARYRATAWAYHFAVDLETCQTRNARRGAMLRVPCAELNEGAERLEPPLADEGFALLLEVDAAGNAVQLSSSREGAAAS